MKLFNNIISKFSQDIAIDLGTANIRVFIKGGKEIIHEPSVLAMNILTGKVLAVGNEARKMIGRTPANIIAVQPLKNGVISDFIATEAMIHYFIQKTKKNGYFHNLINPRVVIGVPSLITEVEVKAVIDSAKSAGAREVYIVDEPIAAAIGAGLPIEEANGNMIVDIGGGTTDIAVISLGGVIVDNTIKIAGDEIDIAIVNYIKNKYNLLIGIKMAEDIKLKYASAVPYNTLEKVQVKGQDIISGLPKSNELNVNEICEALTPVIEKILIAIKEAIEKTPPEILADLILNGVLLSGGGALIHNLDKFLTQNLKLKVKVANDPIFCVVNGIIKLLDNIELLEKLQIKDLILK